MVAVVGNDIGTARQQYSVLQAYKGTFSWWAISVDRLLGLLAQTMGNLDQATAHFRDAIAFCSKGGFRPELGWSCCDYAEALLHPSTGSGHAVFGDKAKAVSLLDEALAIAQGLGMRPLAERVVAVQKDAQSQPERVREYPDGLTHREVDVLRLIATGKTDREIAEDLFISIRTASTHVRNILNKITVGNRAEAATYAATHGLL